MDAVGHGVSSHQIVAGAFHVEPAPIQRRPEEGDDAAPDARDAEAMVSRARALPARSRRPAGVGRPGQEDSRSLQKGRIGQSAGR